MAAFYIKGMILRNAALLYIKSNTETLGDPETAKNDWVSGDLQLLWTMNDLLNKEFILEASQGYHQGPSKYKVWYFFTRLELGLSSLVEIKLPNAVFKSD